MNTHFRFHDLVGVVAVLLCVCAANSLAVTNSGHDVYPRFKPTSISYRDLAYPDAETRGEIRQALEEVGLVFVHDIPGFSTLRGRTLNDAADCALAQEKIVGPDASTAFAKETLKDGSDRLTLLSEVVNDELRNFGELQGRECGKFGRNSKEFRDTVTAVSKIFCSRLDEAAGTSVFSKLFEDASSGTSYNSFVELRERGVQLEHFHTYRSPNKTVDEHTNAVDLHTDHGLFITVAPAIYKHQQRENGFLIQLKSGEIVQPDFGDGNVLMFVLGDGIVNWINPVTNSLLRATPHMVRLPKGSIRSWYGRMFIPPLDAVMQQTGETFGVVREQMRRNLGKESAFSVCADGYEVHSRDLAANCADNELACWNRCVPKPSCPAGEQSGCVNTAISSPTTLCDPIQHSSKCLPKCFSSQPATKNTSEEAFCNGFVVAMHMTGFSGVGDPSIDCLAYLFPWLVLDSSMKYAVACFTTILLGVLVEYVVKLRRDLKLRYSQTNEKWFKLALIVLYGVQIILGYIAMLVAMTYAYVLFIMVVVGLMAGHALFNLHEPATEYSDPCCNFDNENHLESLGVMEPGRSVSDTFPTNVVQNESASGSVGAVNHSEEDNDLREKLLAN